MSSRAYLIVHINTGCHPPVVTHAQISNASPGGLTHYIKHTQYACLMEVGGKSYAEALASILETIERNDDLHWLKKLMSEHFST